MAAQARAVFGGHICDTGQPFITQPVTNLQVVLTSPRLRTGNAALLMKLLPKRSWARNLLKEARLRPSKTRSDPRTNSLLGGEKHQAKSLSRCGFSEM